MWTFKTKVLYVLYGILAKQLPESRHFKLAKKFRGFFAKRIAKSFGKNVNIEKNASFTPGLSIGDNSGVGISCEINGNVTIGKDVMMGPEVVIYTSGHRFDRSDIPMCEQDMTEPKEVVIGDDVWIGANVIILPGVSIGTGCIIGAGSVVTKSIPNYSVAAGNPARIIKNRKAE